LSGLGGLPAQPPLVDHVFALQPSDIRADARRKSVIIGLNGRVVERVRNLSWLTRHWRSIRDFVFLHNSFAKGGGFVACGRGSGVLIANMDDGNRHVTCFNFNLLHDFLDRPIFHDLTLVTYGGGPPRAETIRGGFHRG